MMGGMLKGEGESLTVTIKGGGPLGTILTVGKSDGTVKGYVGNPDVELPRAANGKLPVGAAVGREGRLTVVKDLGLREPYIGMVNLVSGEIAEDFAMYFTASEQVPSLVSLGVLVGEKVEAAGGLIVQMLPGASEAAIQSVEQSAGMFMDISATHARVPSQGRRAAASVASGAGNPFPKRAAYRCDCSRERVERALISLGREELEDMIREQHGAQVDCHFCNKRYRLSEADLRQMLARATNRRSE